MKIIILVLSIGLTAFGQKGMSSRSYISPSRSSSTYSSGSRSYSGSARPSTSPSTPSSRTYSSGGQSNRQSATPSSRTYTSRPSGSSYSTPSSRTYVRPPVVYGGRSYVAVPYYHPYFIGGGYYSSYGGEMPWWGWMMLMHINQQPVAVQSTNGSVNYVDAGTSSFNFTGLLIWLLVLCLIGWLVYALVNRDSGVVHRHY